MKTCPDCNGDGVVDRDTDDERQCPTCGGLGFVRGDDDDHEEVIKTSCDLPQKRGGLGHTVLGQDVPNAYDIAQAKALRYWIALLIAPLTQLVACRRYRRFSEERANNTAATSMAMRIACYSPERT